MTLTTALAALDDACGPLTARQLALLFAVHDGTYETVRGAVAKLGMRKDNITRSADRLASLALLYRKPDPSHRGSVTMWLTERGIAVARAFARECHQ